MALYSRISRLARAWSAYRAGNAFCRYHPLRLWVEPTNHCNLRCVMCPNGQDEGGMERGYMSMGIFREVVNQIAGRVNDINLCHRGEPLLHPEIVRMVAYAHLQGIAVRMNSNGTLMTPHLAEQLIESGLDFISFSFDGLEPAVYESVRRGADFERTVLGIRSLLEAKMRMGAARPFVMIEALDMGDRLEVEGRKKSFLELFKGLPLDGFRIKSMHNWGGNLQGEETGTRGAYLPCSNIWYSLVVGWNGDIVPCPQDWYFKEKLGNIDDIPIMHAWNSPRLLEIRGRIAAAQPEHIEICSHCDLLWREAVAGLPKLNLGPFLTEQLFGYGRLRRKTGRGG